MCSLRGANMQVLMYREFDRTEATNAGDYEWVNAWAATSGRAEPETVSTAASRAVALQTAAPDPDARDRQGIDAAAADALDSEALNAEAPETSRPAALELDRAGVVVAFAPHANPA